MGGGLTTFPRPWQIRVAGVVMQMSRLSSTAAMWTLVLLGNVIGIVMVATIEKAPWLWLSDLTKSSVQHWLLLTVIISAGTSLAAAPFIRFLATGWQDRLDEFKGRLRDGAILAYLKQFWQRKLDSAPQGILPEQLLNQIYVDQYGRQAFVAPILSLLILIFFSVTIVAQTGIDTCIEHRCLNIGAPALSAAGRFAPLGDITLTKGAAAAIGGAYLFAVGDAILRARRRTMNISDVYWYALRMLLAIPMGLAFAEAASPALASLVSFGLGAFPVDYLLRLLRRLTNKTIGTVEAEQDTDELVQLAGVTVPISASLAAEGVESIDELVGVDPVILSIRSGIPFPSILRFASEAVVRLHLGANAKKLEPLGLSNAFWVAQLVEDLETQRAAGVVPMPAEQRLVDAVSQLRDDKNPGVPSQASVEGCFQEIARHGYTRFLRAVG